MNTPGKKGGALFGSTVRAVGLSRHGFRGRGQLAFGVQLTDGREVIMRACFSTF